VSFASGLEGRLHGPRCFSPSSDPGLHRGRFAREYRIIYRVTAGVVQILTVMHERQLLPDEIP